VFWGGRALWWVVLFFLSVWGGGGGIKESTRKKWKSPNQTPAGHPSRPRETGFADTIWTSWEGRGRLGDEQGEGGA